GASHSPLLASFPTRRSSDLGGVREELDRTQQVVMEVAGVRMRIMRPPYGATGQGVEKVTRDAGLAQILWTLDTFDWRDRNADTRSEEHTSELQSRENLVCRL